MDDSSPTLPETEADEPLLIWDEAESRDFSPLFDWLGVEEAESIEIPSGTNGALSLLDLMGILAHAGVVGKSERIGRRKLSRLDSDRPWILFDRKRGAHGCLLPDRTAEGEEWTYHAFRRDAPVMDAGEALRQSLGYAIACEPKRRQWDGEPVEPRKTRRGWFWSVIWQFRRDFLAVLPASLLINAFAVAMPLFIMNVYDRVIPNNAIETLWVLAAGVGIVFAFEFVIRVLRGSFVDHAGKSADRILASKIFQQVLNIDLGHRPPSAGNLASKARSYEAVRDFLSSASIIGLVDFPFAMLMFGVIFFVGGPLGWVPVIAASCVLIFLLMLQPFLRNLSGKSQENLINRQSLMAESANGLETVKAANANVGLGRHMDEHVTKATDVDLRSKRLTHMGSSITVFFIHLTTVGIIVGGAHLVADQSLSMGGLIACVMIAGRSMAPLNMLSNLMLRLQGTLAALRGLDELMALPTEIKGNEFQCRIRHPEFKLVNAGLTYLDQPIAALEEVNLLIQPGEKIGVIGRAGSGKTTLLRLLGRQLLPSTGLLLLNGIDVRQLHPADVRETCSYLPQDGVLFYGTVRENIVLARPDATDEEILEAAKQSGVASWCNRHPAGLNMQVGERGVLLSGGQRQSVLWARCLIASPDVMLLDEPTSSMDLTTERLFSKALAEYLTTNPSRTFILATHKMHLLSLVDRLIVIDQSKVMADGPRDAVLAALKKRKEQESTPPQGEAQEPAEPSAPSAE